MSELTDQRLLSDYAERRMESAFTELVQRHIDLVYSAALRMVRNAHLAEDVTQAVFVALAKNASQLRSGRALEGWLHGVTRNLAANAVRAEVRRRTREQEAAHMNETLSAGSGVGWDQVAPYLDDALSELSEPERDALLLRYFKNQDFRTVGTTLGISDDAAQKRVSRAVERLREVLAKRGVAISASGLVIAISGNAVQAAPLGLLTALSSAVLTSNAVGASAVVSATKLMAMTTLQKTLVTATVTLLAGFGVYQTHRAAQLNDGVQLLQQQQAPLSEKLQKLESELSAASNRVASLMDELAHAKDSSAELAKLRGEVGRLRAQLAEAVQAKPQMQQPPLATARAYYDRAGSHYINHNPEAQLEDLNKALEMDPNLAEAYFMRANLYAHGLPKERGGTEKALADYTRCLELKPNDASARWNRAYAFENLRRYDDSISDWTRYIEGDTDFSNQVDSKSKSMAGAYMNRGKVSHYYKRDYASAIADYTAALQAYPAIEDVHRLRGRCYEELGDMEKAQRDFAIEPKR